MTTSDQRNRIIHPVPPIRPKVRTEPQVAEDRLSLSSFRERPSQGEVGIEPDAVGTEQCGCCLEQSRFRLLGITPPKGELSEDDVALMVQFGMVPGFSITNGRLSELLGLDVLPGQKRDLGELLQRVASSS